MQLTIYDESGRVCSPSCPAQSTEVALLLVTFALIEVCVIVAIILAAEGLLNSATSTHSRRRYMLPARLLAGRVRSASDLTKGARAGQCRLRHVRRATYRWVTAYTPKPYRGRPSSKRAAAYQQWRLHKLSKHIRLYRSRDVLICPLPAVWLAAPTRAAPTELPTSRAEKLCASPGLYRALLPTDAASPCMAGLLWRYLVPANYMSSSEHSTHTSSRRLL